MLLKAQQEKCLFAPHINTYNIELNYMPSTSKHYIKINAYSAIETSFMIDLPTLHHALTNDPDLASVPRAYLARSP